jgi:3-methyladenine DNA glycosylase AlkD
MTKTEVMKELRANGTAQNRKIYRRHGAEGDLFGVSYAFLGKMKRKIKIDQELAEQLWATGNYDARNLATMIADPSSMTAADLQSWARGLEDRHSAAALSNVAADAASAKGTMEKWISSKDEMIACAGWHTLASIARQENGLDDAYFEKYLEKVEAHIHNSDNWVKYAMNNALINIGVRNSKLEKKAIAAAKRIGKVEVDHGETACKTPDAVAYIKKTVAHNKKKMAKRVAKKALSVVAALIVLLPTTLGAQAVLERVDEAVPVAGVVFLDNNGNGVRDAGEPGIEGVAVSDQIQVVRTDSGGRYSLSARGYGLVFVSQPDGYVSVGPFWRRADSTGTDFGLTARQMSSTFSFVHASDTHLSEPTVDRLRRVREMVDSLQPAFVLLTGDLIRDALRVSEEEASGYYELLERELEQFTVPVFTVPGNHEKFGIERHLSLVAPSHPLYGNRMYRHYRGPNYYSFTWGGVHFLGVDTVDYDDLWYHGHVDSLQMEWMRADVAALPPEMPVVMFTHIPFVSGGEVRLGLAEGGAAPSIIEIDGLGHFRHTVYNHQAVLGPLQDRLALVLQGHIHIREVLKFQTLNGEQRLITAAAVVGPAPGGADAYGPLSGITLHRVVDGRIDDGTFLPLDPSPAGR